VPATRGNGFSDFSYWLCPAQTAHTRNCTVSAATALFRIVTIQPASPLGNVAGEECTGVTLIAPGMAAAFGFIGSQPPEIGTFPAGQATPAVNNRALGVVLVAGIATTALSAETCS
jgi:hypothetical protein